MGYQNPAATVDRCPTLCSGHHCMQDGGGQASNTLQQHVAIITIPPPNCRKFGIDIANSPPLYGDVVSQLLYTKSCRPSIRFHTENESTLVAIDSNPTVGLTMTMIGANQANYFEDTSLTTQWLHKSVYSVCHGCQAWGYLCSLTMCRRRCYICTRENSVDI